MTKMSSACLPPVQPINSESDKKHPMYPEYQRYVSGMRLRLLEADSFKGWLNQKWLHAELDAWSNHPRYPEFQRWMFANKGGEKGRSPGPFPENFKLWLDGKRW